ncbi:hypothetical protein F5B20DRAFT_531557 [Whalleya microplaca]|nr:hypothetical protein F5B20DRAFT_531557 [Whalleya microplaca]
MRFWTQRSLHAHQDRMHNPNSEYQRKSKHIEGGVLCPFDGCGKRASSEKSLQEHKYRYHKRPKQT